MSRKFINNHKITKFTAGVEMLYRTDCFTLYPLRTVDYIRCRRLIDFENSRRRRAHPLPPPPNVKEIRGNCASLSPLPGWSSKTTLRRWKWSQSTLMMSTHRCTLSLKFSKRKIKKSSANRVGEKWRNSEEKMKMFSFFLFFCQRIISKVTANDLR